MKELTKKSRNPEAYYEQKKEARANLLSEIQQLEAITNRTPEQEQRLQKLKQS